MVSSRDIDASYNALRNGIEVLVQKRKHELSLSREQDYPLLVLEMYSDAVGFAVINGTPESSFRYAYRAFQKLYRHRHDAWRKLNLSFVVCRPVRGEEHDAFFTSLETDVYFCRKYVVFLGDDLGQIQKRLLRLPFFPLPEGRAGGMVRPPSAQTFLQSLGVGAQIARQIVVPREYSATRIANDLLQAGTSLSPLLSRGVAKGIQQDAPPEQTRVKRVTIEAFRAYKRKQNFDVDADIVVLYGPNGLGKTSFFDALDYVCTGRIGRLCRHHMSPSEFADIARHLGAPPNAGSVSLELFRGENTALMRRFINNWGKAYVGNDTLDRGSALQFLTSAEWGEKRARIETLERLFRATHLFSQSTPELLAEFEEDSRLPFDLVSRMLALDDYASALAKIDAVQTQLDKHAGEQVKENSDLTGRIAEVRQKIEGMQVSQQPEQAGRQLRQMASALGKDLLPETGILVSEGKATLASAREWRAMVESAVKGAEDDNIRSNRLKSGFAQFDRNRTALEDITSRLSESESNLVKAEGEAKEKQGAIRKLTHAIESAQNILKQAVNREAGLAQFDSIRNQYENANNALRQWQHTASRAADEIASVTEDITSLLLKAEKRDVEIVEQRERTQTTFELLQRLEIIQEGITEWDSTRNRAVDLVKSETAIGEFIQVLSAEIATLKVRVAEIGQDLAVSEQTYTSLAASQEELNHLLDQIETFVETGICPTCGTEHGSKGLLLERINSQKVARPAQVEVLATRCRKLRETLKETKVALQTKEGAQLSKTRDRGEVVKALNYGRQKLAVFEKHASDVGLNAGDRLAKELAAMLSKTSAKVQAQRKTLGEAEAHVAEIRKRLSALEAKQREHTSVQKKASDAIGPLEQTIIGHRTRAESIGLSPEMKPQEAAAQTEDCKVIRTKTERRIDQLTKEREALEDIAKVAAERVKELTQTAKSLRESQLRLQVEIQRYENDAAPLLKRDALTQDAVEKKRRLTMERIDRLEALRTRCLNLERALDAVQRSATLAALEADSAGLVKRKRAVVETSKQAAAAKKWSQRVKVALDRQSSHAVADLLESLGPLTTLIQQRLRAVYGFGDVSLAAKGNEIRVLVNWGKQHFKPADYFSDSQKQILMLSLFLSGRLTQTWSGFAPILLDDPVTHFDDLNAFGFVELIRGFVSTLPGKRQFFISTCEDRLFDLMRKKFRGVSGGARFYRFKGMDVDGPVVVQEDSE